MSNTTPDPIIADIFRRMSRRADSRIAKFRTEMLALDETGPCAKCGRAVVALDESETLEASVMHNTLRPVYAVCVPCEGEAYEQERLARCGVPRRVRGATFANYETYDARQTDAVAAVQAWVRDPGKWLLMLLGSSGTGKGHLAAAAVRALRKTALWTSHCDLVNGYHGLDFQKRPRFILRHRSHPVMVIDEMGAKNRTADTEELFFGILDLRYDENVKTILIGNIPWKTTREGMPDIYSLIGASRAESRIATESTTVVCKWADYRLR